MIENITVGDVSAIIISLAAFGTAVAFLTKPIRKIYERLNKLERTIFDENGEPKFPTKLEVDDIKRNTEEIKNAVNIICDAMMVMLDSQINGDNIEGLKKSKADLEKRREIV